jgi:methylthioribulose-1-phosphate dehydratase
MAMTRTEAARALTLVGSRLYARGLAMGTSGNFSVVRAARPLRLIISASSVPKGRLTAKDFLEVDDTARPVGRTRLRPSAETLLHVEIVRRRGAGAILHTHSVWATLLSERFLADGGLVIEGLEMLKGLEGVATHQHREWVPILDNDQDMPRLAARLAETLGAHPGCHGVLLAGHGLYTWGRTLAEAERHVEIFEFLLEVTGRNMAAWR